MSTTTTTWPVPLAEPGPGPAQPRRRVGLTSARSWAELVYAVVDLAPAIAFFVLLVSLLSVGIGLSVVYLGIPILVLALLIARFGGLVQRSLARALLDLPTEAPEWSTPRRHGPIAAIGAVLRDPAHWRAVAYFTIKIVLAPLTFAVAIAGYAYGLGALTFPVWRPFLTEQVSGVGSVYRGEQWWPDFLVDTWPGMAVLAAVGLGILWCAPRVVAFLVTFDRILIIALLNRRA
jgi:hypothetical protein